MTVPAEAMDTLAGLDDDPAARHDVRLGHAEGPRPTLPWGPTMRSRVNWEMGGDLSLRGETPEPPLCLDFGEQQTASGVSATTTVPSG